MGSVNLELVDEFVGIIKNNWYKRDSVNWDSFTKKVIKRQKIQKRQKKRSQPDHHGPAECAKRLN